MFLAPFSLLRSPLFLLPLLLFCCLVCNLLPFFAKCCRYYSWGGGLVLRVFVARRCFDIRPLPILLRTLWLCLFIILFCSSERVRLPRPSTPIGVSASSFFFIGGGLVVVCIGVFLPSSSRRTVSRVVILTGNRFSGLIGSGDRCGAFAPTVLPPPYFPRLVMGFLRLDFPAFSG